MADSYIPDSHVLLWYFWGEKEHLSAAARELMGDLEDQERHFIIPSTVLLEIMRACEKKKIGPKFVSLLEWLNEMENVSFMSLDVSAVEKVCQIPSRYSLHDRAILASAIIQKAALITKDGELRKSKLVETIW